MKLKVRLYSPARLKQLANCLVLVLGANILLENLSSNLLLASPRNTRKFSQVQQSSNLKKTAKTGFLSVNTVGATCDPTVANSCGNGLQCDQGSKTCLINASNSCFNNLTSCAAGLICDQASTLCCMPVGGSCLSNLDCCVASPNFPGVDLSAACEPQNGTVISPTTPGICKLAPQANCATTPTAATNCGINLVCGVSSVTNVAGTCCIDPATSLAAASMTCLYDGDCCAGYLCDGTEGINQCVQCIPAGHDCGGIETSCCSGYICDQSKVCVINTDPTGPAIGATCSQYSDCGGVNWQNLTCAQNSSDQTNDTCQLCGGLGTVCTGSANCCANLADGQLVCDIGGTGTCCMPQGATCLLDTDCCTNGAGTMKCAGGICVLTQIAPGELCGASLVTTVETTANASTLCLQNDLYNRPVTCNPVNSGGGAVPVTTVNLCGVTPGLLIPAGQTCTDLTVTVDGINVTYNNCLGWSANPDHAQAACLLVNSSDNKICCSLVGGACDPTHANNGSSDCCYNTLTCNTTLNQCEYIGTVSQQLLGQNSKSGTNLGATDNFDPVNFWEGVGTALGVVTIFAIVVYCLRGKIIHMLYTQRVEPAIQRALPQALQGILKLSATQLLSLIAAYDSSLLAKDCDPAIRARFIAAALEVVQQVVGDANWNLFLTQAGVNSADFTANFSAAMQLAMQQASGEAIGLPGMVVSVVPAAAESYATQLLTQARAGLRRLGVTGRALSDEFDNSLTAPLLERAVPRFARAVSTRVVARIPQATAAQDALTAQGLKCLRDLAKVATYLVTNGAAPEAGTPVANLVQQMDIMVTVLEKSIDVLGGGPGGAADLPGGGPVRPPAPVLDPAATNAQIKRLIINDISRNQAVLAALARSPEGKFTTIDAAFIADPFDFAKLYFAIATELLAEHGVAPSSAEIVAALKQLETSAGDLIFSPDATFAEGSSFSNIFQNNTISAALIAAGAGLDTANLIAIFRGGGGGIPLPIKRFMLKMVGVSEIDGESIDNMAEAALNALDEDVIRTALEDSMPILSSVMLNIDGNPVPLISAQTGISFFNRIATTEWFTNFTEFLGEL